MLFLGSLQALWLQAIKPTTLFGEVVPNVLSYRQSMREDEEMKACDSCKMMATQDTWSPRKAPQDPIVHFSLKLSETSLLWELLWNPLKPRCNSLIPAETPWIVSELPCNSFETPHGALYEEAGQLVHWILHCKLMCATANLM